MISQSAQLLHHGHRAFLLLFAFGALSGCYSTREIGVLELQRLGDPVVCRIVQQDGDLVRVVVNPGDSTPNEILCYRCVYGPASWEVRYSGWPAVYSSGKYWRRESIGELMQIPSHQVDKVLLEELNWTRTVIISPISVPFGALDFLFHNARLGFETLDDRADSFSPPVEGSIGSSAGL
jgi:hypothetical protein